MKALSNVEIEGKTYKAGDSLPKLDAWNEKWLAEIGAAKAEPKESVKPTAKERVKSKQKEKADDVRGSDK